MQSHAYEMGTPAGKEGEEGEGRSRFAAWCEHSSICCNTWLVKRWLIVVLALVATAALFAGLYGGLHELGRHRSDRCFEEMSKWKIDDYVNPNDHAVAIVAGRHLAVLGNNFKDSSCITRYAKALKAKGMFHTGSYSSPGRRLETDAQILENCQKTLDEKKCETALSECLECTTVNQYYRNCILSTGDGDSTFDNIGFTECATELCTNPGKCDTYIFNGCNVQGQGLSGG